MYRYITITATIDPDLYETVVRYASDNKTPFNYVLRDALSAFVASNEVTKNEDTWKANTTDTGAKAEGK